MIKRVDHVAIVVRRIEEALEFYRDVLGIEPAAIRVMPAEGVRIAFLPAGGPKGSQLELIEPIDPTSGVAHYLAKRGEGLHHICLEVDDIDQELHRLRARAVAVLDATPRQAAEGRAIFLHPTGTHGVLLELVERAEE
jgi:methylmalonyl-CoA epimerase